MELKTVGLVERNQGKWRKTALTSHKVVKGVNQNSFG